VYCQKFGDNEGSDDFFGIVCRHFVRKFSKRGERIKWRYIYSNVYDVYISIIQLNKITFALPLFSLVIQLDFNDGSRSPCKHAIKHLVKNSRQIVHNPKKNVREPDTVQTVDKNPSKIP